MAKDTSGVLDKYYDKMLIDAATEPIFYPNVFIPVSRRKTTYLDKTKNFFSAVAHRVSHAWSALRGEECDGGDY